MHCFCLSKIENSQGYCFFLSPVFEIQSNHELENFSLPDVYLERFFFFFCGDSFPMSEVDLVAGGFEDLNKRRNERRLVCVDLILTCSVYVSLLDFLYLVLMTFCILPDCSGICLVKLITVFLVRWSHPFDLTCTLKSFFYFY